MFFLVSNMNDQTINSEFYNFVCSELNIIREDSIDPNNKDHHM